MFDDCLKSSRFEVYFSFNMHDIIQLLPDSVANQIAAGEVIQRPASIVKELVENAVDAGATEIKVIIKDAGKTLVQVIDNGCGMSVTDARLSFERHATSKIRNANDLFCIRTMGFRGEALASIAAIAQVEMKTKRTEDALGTQINISASVVESQEPVACSDGTSFSVKNLFYNVPARRKFLKSNQAELRHIYDEFHRISLANCNIAFSLVHNGDDVYVLPASQLKQRIVNIFGKALNQNLITVTTETTLIKISGFIGKPEFAKKTASEQFFFVNNRYMKHPYFYRAVLNAYEKILPPETVPSYFLFLQVEPSNIDINIHPTKTEIKFTDETAIWQILHAAVKQALGKFNIVPSIDFEIEKMVDIPLLTRDTEIVRPEIKVDQEFNPFKENYKSSTFGDSYFNREKNFNSENNLKNWKKLFDVDIHGTEKQGKVEFTGSNIQSHSDYGEEANARPGFFQLKNRYIFTPVKSGMMVIDICRAHERILFENFTELMIENKGVVQREMFPVSITFSKEDTIVVNEIINELHSAGFEISSLGGDTFSINGTPAALTGTSPAELLQSIINTFKETDSFDFDELYQKVALSLAKAASVKRGKVMQQTEMQVLFDSLFACAEPGYTFEGLPVVSIISYDELDKKFNRN